MAPHQPSALSSSFDIVTIGETLICSSPRHLQSRSPHYSHHLVPRIALSSRSHSHSSCVYALPLVVGRNFPRGQLCGSKRPVLPSHPSGSLYLLPLTELLLSSCNHHHQAPERHCLSQSLSACLSVPSPSLADWIGLGSFQPQIDCFKAFGPILKHARCSEADFPHVPDVLPTVSACSLVLLLTNSHVRGKHTQTLSTPTPLAAIMSPSSSLDWRA